MKEHRATLYLPFSFFHNQHMLLYNLTGDKSNNRIDILHTGVKVQTKAVLSQLHTFLERAVNGRPPGTHHPREALRFRYASVCFVFLQTLCFMLPLPVLVLASGPLGLRLPSAAAAGGVSDACFSKRIVIFTFGSG